MKSNPFWKYLVFLSLVTVVALVIISQVEVFKSDILLSIIGFVFMVASTAAFYIASIKALESTNKMAFIQLVMVNVIVKIVLIMAIVATYFKIVKPESKLFILPFISIYFVFTIFETIFTYKLSNKNK